MSSHLAHKKIMSTHLEYLKKTSAHMENLKNVCSPDALECSSGPLKDYVCSPGALYDDFYSPTGREDDDIISLDDVEVVATSKNY
jgi:hypothetical protein